VTDLYWGAFVYLALGERVKAFDILKLNQEINPYFSSQQRVYLYDLISTSEELKHALPARYPQVIEWIDHFSQNRPAQFFAWSGVFEEALSRSMDEMEQRLHSQQFEPQLFAEYVKTMSLSPVIPLSDKLRKRFDLVLAQVHRGSGNDLWADILEHRSALERITVAKGTIADDRHPQRTMLAHWVGDTDSTIWALDGLGRSIGFFLPSGEKAEMVVLQSGQKGQKLTKDALQIFVSNDNIDYQQSYNDYDLHALAVDGQNIVVIKLKNIDFRFFKIITRVQAKSSSFNSHLPGCSRCMEKNRRDRSYHSFQYPMPFPDQTPLPASRRLAVPRDVCSCRVGAGSAGSRRTYIISRIEPFSQQEPLNRLILSNIGYGLTRLGAQGVVELELAAQLSRTVDARTWRCRLQNGVLFASHRRAYAADVKDRLSFYRKRAQDFIAARIQVSR